MIVAGAHVVDYGSGTPLLFSSGLGGAWFDWTPVADLLPGRRVVLFDRPGTGESPPSDATPSLRREVALLAALAEHIGEPVVLVAHSMGAFHAEAFARVHPGRVRGLVLVDPSCEPDAKVCLRTAHVFTPLELGFGRLIGFLGVARELGPWGRAQIVKRISHRPDPAPPELVREVYGRGEMLGTVLAENTAYPEMAADLVDLRARLPFPDVPLEVLTALGDFKHAEKAEAWTSCHAELARLSPRGHQTVLPEALHLIQIDQPGSVAAAVRRVL